MPAKEFVRKMRIKLEEEKKETEEKIKKYSHISEQNDNPDSEDIAQQATEDMLGESLVEVHENILERINMALEKIAKGGYGICEKCDLKISEEELEKQPWAEYCGKCK